MTKIKITPENESEVIKCLREYYRKNFQNGGSSQSFVNWIESKLMEMGYLIEEEA